TDAVRDVAGMGLEREVAGVEEAHDGPGNVPLEGLRARRKKERIVLAPYGQQRWLVGPKIVLEGRVQRDIALVVAEQVELGVSGARASQIEIVEVLAIRRHHGWIGNAMRVLPAGRLRSEEGTERVSVRRRRVLPIGLDRTPPLAQTLLIGVAVLRDDLGDPLRVAHRKPES